MDQQQIKLQSTKADLLLINEITKPSKIAQLQAPSNMQELHNLLKFKNTKSGRSKQQKQNAQAWLNKEGIDISPLMQRVKKAREITIQKQELKKIQEDCLFYIPDMSYKKIDEYLIKAHDYGMMNIIQKTMKKSNLSKIIKNRIENKFSEISCIGKQPFESKPLSLITTIKTQTRDELKRQKYLKSITALAKNNIQRQELIHYFSSTVNKKFWKIFSKHVKCLTEHRCINYEEKMTYLFLDSLKQVQDEYDSYLARGNQSLHYYMSSNYLEKMDRRQQKYIRDKEHQAFWGKVFVFYRAGRKKEMNNLLSSRNEVSLMRDLNIADRHIEQKKPIKFLDVPYENNNIDDVFRKQLIFALKAQAKYASDLLSDPNTLDIVWILLRNLAIFEGNPREAFESLRGKIFQTYSNQSFLTDQQLYNYFYLLSYEDIAQMGLSEIMDQDDYVHFLICLYENPALITGKYEKVRKLLNKQLILYVRELINLGRSEYVYYLPLIPKEDRVTEISNLISSSNLLSTFNWQYLRSSIPSREEFQQIVKGTLEKYILTSNDYLSAAEKYIDLLNDEEKAIRCLLQFLIKSFYNNSFNDQAIYEAESACDKYLYRDAALQNQFRFVLNFVIECRRLLQLLRDRKDSQIYQLIRNSNFILLGAVLPAKHQSFFDNLISLTGFGLDVYFKFLKNIIKGLEIYCLRQHRHSELIDFISLLEQNLAFIQKYDQYRSFMRREEAASLFELINSLHYQVSQY